MAIVLVNSTLLIRFSHTGALCLAPPAEILGNIHTLIVKSLSDETKPTSSSSHEIERTIC